MTVDTLTRQKNFFDLTKDSYKLDKLIINQKDQFNCVLFNVETGETYDGFVLAHSPQGNRFTICEIDFHKSDTDNKFQPRLIFRKTDDNLMDVRLRADTDNIRIPFQTGEDGYREFWKLIFFLYKFKEQIDFGEFDGKFQVISREQVQAYLNDKDNLDEIRTTAKMLNVEVSEVMKTAATLKMLNSAKDKLNHFIQDSSSETDVQNWLDENNRAYIRERCIIFGIEFIDFKREGRTSSKRFDLLTRIGLKDIEFVLIELKSPSDDLFQIETKPTSNGSSQEYHLHPKLARAIPQILEYKSTLESKNSGDPELTALGINHKIEISKCIIVIGKNSSDARWVQNRKNLSKSLNSSLEVWTYSDLLTKLTSTIQNIEALSN